MFRIGEKGAALCRKLGWGKPTKSSIGPNRLSRANMVANVIHAREQNDMPTTLRMLHKLTPLTQPQALKAVAELEASRMVVLKREANDVLGSSIILTQGMRDQLKNSGEKSAG